MSDDFDRPGFGIAPERRRFDDVSAGVELDVPGLPGPTYVARHASFGLWVVLGPRAFGASPEGNLTGLRDGPAVFRVLAGELRRDFDAPPADRFHLTRATALAQRSPDALGEPLPRAAAEAILDRLRNDVRECLAAIDAGVARAVRLDWHGRPPSSPWPNLSPGDALVRSTELAAAWLRPLAERLSL